MVPWCAVYISDNCRKLLELRCSLILPCFIRETHTIVWVLEFLVFSELGI